VRQAALVVSLETVQTKTSAVLADALSEIPKGLLRGLMLWTSLYHMAFSAGAPAEHEACRHRIVSVFASRIMER
jgi:hypothetical protein